jgi:hypothetical protein
MRKDDKTFTTCLALFADFICLLKQNPSNMHCIAKLGSGGCSGGKGRDASGRGGGGCGRGGRGSHRSASEGRPLDQSEVDKVTWLQTNKYYTAKEYEKFTAAKKAWIHQHRTKSPAPKCKVTAVLRGEDNTAMESDNDRDLFGDHNDKSVSARCSTQLNTTNPALVCQEKKTMRRP